MYWEVGLTKRPNQYFTDPQQWNSYSYVRNNPINLVDPTGEMSWNDLNPFYVESAYSPSVEDLKIPAADRMATWNNLSSFIPIGGGALKNLKKDFEIGKEIVEGVFSGLTKDAIAGGRYAGDLKAFVSMTKNQLVKSIKSFDKVIIEHKNLIKDPVKYLTEYRKPNNWLNMTKEAQTGLIKKWEKDIQRALNKSTIAKDILTTKK